MQDRALSVEKHGRKFSKFSFKRFPLRLLTVSCVLFITAMAADISLDCDMYLYFTYCEIWIVSHRECKCGTACELTYSISLPIHPIGFSALKTSYFVCFECKDTTFIDFAYFIANKVPNHLYIQLMYISIAQGDGHYLYGAYI